MKGTDLEECTSLLLHLSETLTNIPGVKEAFKHVSLEHRVWAGRMTFRSSELEEVDKAMSMNELC